MNTRHPSKFLRASLVCSILCYGSTAMANRAISIGGPSQNALYQANAPVPCFGSITWVVNKDTRPNGAVVYLHQGGKTGVITNAGFATIQNVDLNAGDEDWQVTLNAVPTKPPAGGGGNASYTVEVDALFKGIVCVNPGPNGTTIPVVDTETILVQGG